MLPFKVSAFQRQQLGSPSVTLEKGSYRMRRPTGAAYEPHNPSPISRKRSPTSMSSTFTALLVILLAFACLTCFGCAYYLYSTRWETWNTSAPSIQADDAKNMQVIRFDLEADVDALLQRNDPREKFLSYLPHSGFHNQRIAFENALVLARLLNRTLLAPPVRLGNPHRYVKFTALKRLWALSGKDGLFHCGSAVGRSYQPEECFDYFDYTLVPWTWLLNLTDIRTHQLVLQRWNMTDEWYTDALGLNAVGDVFTLEDTHPYHYRFVDHTEDRLSLSRYTQRMLIGDLMQINERLLQLGTLFGSSRLHLRDPVNLEIRTMIRRSMVPSVPGLDNMADSIKRSLGGSYLGAHIRLGDGRFMAQGQNSTVKIWKDLVRHTFALDSNTLIAMDQATGPERDLSWLSLIRPAFDYPDLTEAQVGLPCRRSKHQVPYLAPFNIPLFISTDVAEPAHHPLLQIFLTTFPCTFFLSDFNSKLQALNMKNGYDGVSLREHLIPFLNGIVLGKAWKAVGTEGSTFSAFITDVLWRHYQGLEIKQRG